MRLPFLSGAYEGISLNTSAQEAINFFYEPPAPGEQHEGAMVPVHGAALFDTLANAGDIRQVLFDPGDSLLYVVSDNDLYSVTSGAVETARDVLATTSGRVEMAINPLERAIVTVDGNTGLHYDIATTTGTDIIDTDFPDTATTVDYINGRFLVNDPTVAGKFWWSDINDGTSWDSASNGTAQSLTSSVQKIIVDEDRIFLFGDQQTEIWWNKGDADEVFARYAQMEVGLAAPAAATIFDNTIALLTNNERGGLQVARVGDGYSPQYISTPEMTRKWESYSTVSDAFMYNMQIDGHDFLILTFPTANATWAFDAAVPPEKAWHQRSAAFSAGAPTREKANCHAYCSSWAGGTHILGDFNSTGKLFSASTTVWTFDSVAMERQLTGPTFYAMNEDRLRISEVQLDMEESVAGTSDTGTDRQVILYWSKDNGHTFSSGKTLDVFDTDDAYNSRVMARKLGKSRAWTFRLYTKMTGKPIVKGLHGRLYGENRYGAAA